MIEYVGRDKNQNPHSTCATHALTAFLTQWYYNTYGEVKEFDVNDINPNNDIISMFDLIDKLKVRGIAEEGKNNNEEFVINLDTKRLDYVEQLLETEELIIASVQGKDPRNPTMGHAMLYLGAEYVSPSMYDVYFQNSWGNGILILRNQNLGGLIASNNFYEVTLKEKYYREEIELQENILDLSTDYDPSKPLLVKQLINGENKYTTVAPVRNPVESMGDTVTWIPSDGTHNGKVRFTSKAREVK